MNTRRIRSEPLLYLMAGIMAAAGFVSAVLTSDTRWTEWHLSRLGEGGQLSSYVFNFGSALCSLLMGGLARLLKQDIATVNAPARAIRRAQRIVGVGFYSIAVCMMGVAVFPFDRFPVVHNIFGYSMTLVYAFIIVCIPIVLPIFRRSVVAISYGFLTLMAVLFGCYFATNGTSPHLLYIEILGLAFFFTWMIMLVRAIKANRRVATT